MTIDNQIDETDLDSAFIEQAEYLTPSDFKRLSAEHPNEESVIRKLTSSGAKLLVGPRGCGKTTLLLKAYYDLLGDQNRSALPIYVNFKLSLKLEPLYVNTPNAAYWFRLWLVLMVYKGLHSTARDVERGDNITKHLPAAQDIEQYITKLEQGSINAFTENELLSLEGLVRAINRVLLEAGWARAVIYLDDAAHAFSPRQQEDFFDFFREIKSREISPKAAIYPGITTHSASFHVGHDAEQIDVWMRPDKGTYLQFMRELATKRFGGALPTSLTSDTAALDLMAFAAFGVPRSFLAMVRDITQDPAGSTTNNQTIDRRTVLEISKRGREAAHNVYESLSAKLPSYREFISTGRLIYQNILSAIKDFNRGREDNNQAIEFGLKKPIPIEIEKVLGFFQYAGLIMPSGENSRGVKGVFELYLLHAGDLMTENAIIGRRTKSIDAFIGVFSSRPTQVWPRISPDSLTKGQNYESLFRLSLPKCQVCGTERINEHARFCSSCGSQLKNASLYNELVGQDISLLPISKKIVTRIKQNSSLKTIKDILLDSDKKQLRGVPYIGPVRAANIVSYAEEYLA